MGCCILVSSRKVELQQGGNWWLTKISTGLVDLFRSITRKPYTQLCLSRKKIDVLLPRQHKQRSLETRFAAGETMTSGTKTDISISKLYMKDYIIVYVIYILRVSNSTLFYMLMYNETSYLTWKVDGPSLMYWWFCFVLAPYLNTWNGSWAVTLHPGSCSSQRYLESHELLPFVRALLQVRNWDILKQTTVLILAVILQFWVISFLEDVVSQTSFVYQKNQVVAEGFEELVE